MEFKDEEIYEILLDEFILFTKTKEKSNVPDFHFVEFIRMKDLGIVCISFFGDRYRIVDEKKWTIARIKYGF